jgi:hypothetical protein
MNTFVCCDAHVKKSSVPSEPVSDFSLISRSYQQSNNRGFLYYQRCHSLSPSQERYRRMTAGRGCLELAGLPELARCGGHCGEQCHQRQGCLRNARIHTVPYMVVLRWSKRRTDGASATFGVELCQPILALQHASRTQFFMFAMTEMTTCTPYQSSPRDFPPKGESSLSH